MYSIIAKQYYKFVSYKRNRYISALVKDGLQIGKKVEIIGSFFFDPSHCYLISIGNNCTICPEVRLIAHDASTFKYLGCTKIGKIVIEDNCFIGDSAIILPNVRIGENTIIGAGSVVKRNIPKNSVAAGNPAKVICTLDEYLNKIRTIKADKPLFGNEYLIYNLDDNKRKEINDFLENDIGFMV